MLYVTESSDEDYGMEDVIPEHLESEVNKKQYRYTFKLALQSVYSKVKPLYVKQVKVVMHMHLA